VVVVEVEVDSSQKGVASARLMPVIVMDSDSWAWEVLVRKRRARNGAWRRILMGRMRDDC
jgi:hypothetical protein